MKKILFFIIVIVVAFAQSCRKDDTTEQSETQQDSSEIDDNYARLYVLNEGNMNENRSTLDDYDYATWTYTTNIYPSVNPSVVNGLGDVGNDLQIYGDKMYAVLNGSNKIEVMEATTAKRLGQIDLTNGRYITFYQGFAYASSYNRTITGTTDGDDNSANGIVVKIDTTTLKIVDSVTVGRQPDGVAIANGKLYVANSGGYSPSNYERIVSVIDLSTFEIVKSIDVAINLNLMQVDDEDNVYVSSRGDYLTVPSRLFKIDSQQDEVVDSFDFQVASFCVSKDTAYIVGKPFSGSSSYYYKTLATKSGTVLTDMFISDNTNSSIQLPYGILVNPESRNIYLTDAIDYQTSGNVYCFSPQGESVWEFKAGQIPGHLALLKK
ncbi:MAG: YncE family protein [Chitinophagaceae bacterium]